MALAKGHALARIRWSGTLAGVAALAALAVIGPPGKAAQAATATSYDQITGIGPTDSAVTVPWTQGLLDNTNTPITAANADRGSASPTSPLAFMYPSFQGLTVNVSQTQDITDQGITVSWSWTGASGQPTQTIINGAAVAGNFLQLMECYGDSSSGPSPQDCEYGSPGMLPANILNADVGSRTGDLCDLGSNGQPLPPNTGTPPDSQDGDTAVFGCDPEEPGSSNPSDVDPSDPTQYFVPFVPVNDTSSPAYTDSALSSYFTQFNTNEVQEAVTNQDGDGQLQFETLTGTQAPGLGCGELESNGQVRNCWLVIVPRGEYEPNGYEINPGGGESQDLYSSPLSASNWAMRIQIHLDYEAVPQFCPINVQETETVGTQVIARAVQSWQLALNSAANCTRIYGYSAVPEATSTQQLASSSSGVGLAFTTIPIGSEAARDGGPPTSLPQILYAPVAVSAVGFGFNINESTGYITTPVKLTPELLAKALTQVYKTDLPDYDPAVSATFGGPSWSAPNPVNISEDPEFEKLNPEVKPTPTPDALAPLLTEDHSAINQQIWEWIQADPAASAWLDQGTVTATNNVAVDPDYEALQLGAPPAQDEFPRAYTGVLDLPNGVGDNESGTDQTQHSLDLLPYVNNYEQAASDVLTANDPATIGSWDPTAVSPAGTTGYWEKVGAEQIGQTFMWGISDTGDLAADGLIDAELCTDSGTNCVGPSTASLTAAVDSATTDSAGLLEVNPADPGTGGYPLTEVTYAAVATDVSSAELTDYADLIAYAVGAGQTPGVAPGDLPPGYLPLTASLKAQALTVVAELRTDAGTSSTSSSTGAGVTSQTSGSGAGAAAGNSATSLAAPSTPGITGPAAALAATITPRQPVGPIRWTLLAVVMAGAACALGGTVLRSAGVARWLHRMRL
jgi:hypothetical protein